ncbi:hypothetical protein ACFYVL_35490 [Streptomyces sp. NPDC004111]|uniref:hypothetical protein n=1 Tax=Streptomyces sp. NPDC004111 TaxID=3364690 RepID=UPI00367F65AB
MSGAGKLWYVESADHDIRFGVNAVGVPFSRPVPGIPAGMATDARGTVRFSHLVPGAKKPMRAVADVDCLVTSGRTATLTAIIRSSDAHEKGTRIGISVQQGEHGAPDRLGFSWGQANLDTEARDAEGNVMLSEVGTCMAPAPFTKVVEGGFRVVHADVLKNPGSPAKGARGSAGQGATGDAGRSGGQGIAKGAEKGLGKGGVEGVEGAGRRG